MFPSPSPGLFTVRTADPDLRPSSLLRALRLDYASGRYCDLRLHCGLGQVGVAGGVVSCHRLVVASASPLLRRLLRARDDAGDADADVHLPDFGAEKVRAWVDRLYDRMAGDVDDDDGKEADPALVDLLASDEFGRINDEEEEDVKRPLTELLLEAPVEEEREEKAKAPGDQEEVRVQLKRKHSTPEEKSDQSEAKRGRRRRVPSDDDDDDDVYLAYFPESPLANNGHQDEDEDDRPLRPKRGRRRPAAGRRRRKSPEPRTTSPDLGSESTTPTPTYSPEELTTSTTYSLEEFQRLAQSSEASDLYVRLCLSRDEVYTCALARGRLNALCNRLRTKTDYRCLVGVDAQLGARVLAWHEPLPPPSPPSPPSSSTSQLELERQYDMSCLAMKSVFGLSDVDVYACNVVGSRQGIRSIASVQYLEKCRLFNKYKRLTREEREAVRRDERLEEAVRRGPIGDWAGGRGEDHWRSLFCRNSDNASSRTSPSSSRLEVKLRLQPDLPIEELQMLATLSFNQDQARGDVTMNVIQVPADKQDESAAELCLRILFDVWTSKKLPKIEHILHKHREQSKWAMTPKALDELEAMAQGGGANGGNDGANGGANAKLRTKQCEECGETFELSMDYDDRNRMYQHMQRHKFENFTCDCDVAFKDDSEKRKHIKLVHSNGKYAKCDQCFMIVPTGSLSRHKEQSHGDFICDICGFTSKASYLNHNHKYNNHVPHDCKICGLTFEGKLKLKQHNFKVHPTGETFDCDLCEARFRRKDGLVQHKKRKHVPDSEKKYRCELCSRGFINKASLEDHKMSVHIRSFSHPCRYQCGAVFNLPGNRGLHERNMHGAVWDKAFPKAQGQGEDMM